MKIESVKFIEHEHRDPLSTDYYIRGVTLIGWLGVNYEDTGLFETKQDAERGINSDYKLHELLSAYDEKKVKITIEIIEE